MGKYDAYEEGKAAFKIGLGKNDAPYGISKTERVLWRSGWQAEYAQEQKEKEEDTWNRFSSACPWHYGGCCQVLANEVNEECSKHNCAPLYFKENYHD